MKTFLKHAEAVGFHRRWIASILALQFLAVVFEGLGIGLFVPVLQFIQSNGDVAALQQDSVIWTKLVGAFRGIGLPVTLASLLAVSFAMFLIRQVFMYMRLVFTNAVTFDLMRGIRQKAFATLLHAKMAYHDKLQTGRFVNEMTTELVNATGNLVSYINFIGYILMGTVYALSMLVISPTMTVAAIVIFTTTAVLLAGLLRRTREAGRRVTEYNQGLGQFMLERLRVLRLIRLASMEAAEIDEVNRLTNEQRDSLVQLSKITSLTGVLAEPLILVGSFTLIYLAVTVFFQPIEVVLLVFAIVFRMLPVVKDAMIRRQAYLSTLAAVDVVTGRLHELEASSEGAAGGESPHRLARAIEFDQVRFSYAPDSKEKAAALNGVSVEIPACSITAIVGPSGAGKSTLIDMIPRLRTPDEGAIYFDGHDISQLELGAVRRSVAYAPQDPLILDVTVAEHIRYGNTDASDEEVCRAAELANADEFIERLDKGYDTRLGEGGRILSGGQRQRLDLARALAGSAPILILDEPTSHLDAESEARFLSALKRINAETDTTILIIAHRFSTLSIAGRIVVLENGQVRAVGMHAELVVNDTWYRNAYGKHSISAAPHSDSRVATAKHLQDDD